MPTRDPRLALDHTRLAAETTRATEGRPAASFGFGLEIELLPVAATSPLRRPRLHGPAGLLTQLSTPSAISMLDAGTGAGAETGWWCHGRHGARLSFEPGGQVEVASAYHATPQAAMGAAAKVAADLAMVCDAQHLRLAAAGIDVWSPGTAPQQLRQARYPAMDAYLGTRGPAGRTMMRDTCALQLNLDLGTGSEARARWETSNLLAPVATASFACSPSTDGHTRSRRSLAWQRLDPTRTGFAAGFLAASGSPAQQLASAALDADVLLVDTGRRITPGRPGWRFGDWLKKGHPELGWPTVEDLRGHLTTLFHEVRPRGHLEIRSIDAVPARWRPAAAALYVGAVYEARARDRIREVLEPHRAQLPALLQRAATAGVADPALCALAVEVWSFALSGARRLAPRLLRPVDVSCGEEFVDRYIVRGRCPADELAALLRADPIHALTWAAEPLPVRSEVHT